MVITVKAYLQAQSNATAEIRRFVFVSSHKTDFNDFRDKLGKMFPSLAGNNFSITWNDDENDCITMSSDEELAQAVASNGHKELLKVTIIPETNSSSEPISQAEKVSVPNIPKVNNVDDQCKSRDQCHPNIMCDGCNEDVRGARFKCLECVDFDLCQNCFAKEIHPDHDMIRIVSPTGMMHTGHWFLPMRTIWQKLARKAAHHQEKLDARQAKLNSRMAWGNHRFSREKWQEWASKPEGSKPTQCRWRYTPMTEEDATAGAAASDPKQPKDSKSSTVQNENADFLKRIGETVANFLDPLGIDVLIDVETKEDPKSAKPRCDLIPEVLKPTVTDTTTQVSDEIDTNAEKPIDQQSPKPKPEELHENGWTLVNRTPLTGLDGNPVPDTTTNNATQKEQENICLVSPEQPADASAPINPIKEVRTIPVRENHNVSTSTPSVLYSTGTPTLYPTLEEDPRITEALYQMINMGYSNEGGWLSALLKAKTGDIAAVLDVLHPQLP